MRPYTKQTLVILTLPFIMRAAKSPDYTIIRTGSSIAITIRDLDFSRYIHSVETSNALRNN